MTCELINCSKCKTPTPIELLDAKNDGTGNYTILECRTCYGPGWAPQSECCRYNEAAVDEAIAASNRAGRKIGRGEAKKIHGLLKGWRGDRKPEGAR